MEELLFIDESLVPLIEIVKSQGNYLIIITSDHPDDAKRPLMMISDVITLTKYQGIKYHVTQLKPIIESVLELQNHNNQVEGIFVK